MVILAQLTDTLNSDLLSEKVSEDRDAPPSYPTLGEGEVALRLIINKLLSKLAIQI
jgi:hypothetical protein